MNRPPQALAVLGTGSDVGKSLIAAALCRLWFRAGRRVVPFKAQNMSLNSYVTEDGGEIGRAQALQAWACGLMPSVDMNPVLLKPESDRRSQVVVQGKVLQTVDAATYYHDQRPLWSAITQSYRRLCGDADAVVLEGAGSAAEVNLMSRDLVNWRMVDHANAEVLLVADIDRGGVFAQVVGTLDLLPQACRRRIMGVVINKFRGDAALFRDGVEFLVARTGLPVLGVIPFLRDHRLDQEDSLDRTALPSRTFSPSCVNIAIVLLPRMSNFTDFNVLAIESDVAMRYVTDPLDATQADVVILPGTKNTLADLRSLRVRGWESRLNAHVRSGGELIGICGGYQMLGVSISDPLGLEEGGTSSGLGFLDVSTELQSPKVCRQVTGEVLRLDRLEGSQIEGYEIHMGRLTRGTMPACLAIRATRMEGPVAEAEGTVAPGGRVWGSSVHGLFDHAAFRQRWLNRVRDRKGLPLKDVRPAEGILALRHQAIDRWADHVATHLEIDRLLAPRS